MIKLLSLMINIIVALMVLLIVYVTGPVLEGKYFPVTRGTVIERRVPFSSDSTLVRGYSYKVRPNCSYVKLEWWYGDPNGNKVLVPMTMHEATKLRAGGKFLWGDWELKLNPLQVKNFSHAYVYHSCHPLWETTTLFYVGEQFIIGKAQ